MNDASTGVGEEEKKKGSNQLRLLHKQLLGFDLSLSHILRTTSSRSRLSRLSRHLFCPDVASTFPRISAGLERRMQAGDVWTAAQTTGPWAENRNPHQLWSLFFLIVLGYLPDLLRFPLIYFFINSPNEPWLDAAVIKSPPTW